MRPPTTGQRCKSYSDRIQVKEAALGTPKRQRTLCANWRPTKLKALRRSNTNPPKEMRSAKHFSKRSWASKVISLTPRPLRPHEIPSGNHWDQEGMMLDEIKRLKRRLRRPCTVMGRVSPMELASLLLGKSISLACIAALGHWPSCWTRSIKHARCFNAALGSHLNSSKLQPSAPRALLLGRVLMMEIHWSMSCHLISISGESIASSSRM